MVENAKMPKKQNPKSKIPNPKQYQNSNDQNSKLVLKIGILNLEFVLDLGFWILGFIYL